MILVSSENTWKKSNACTSMLARKRKSWKRRVHCSFILQSNQCLFFLSKPEICSKKRSNTDRSSFQSQNFGDDYITWHFRRQTVFSSSSLSHDSVFRPKIDNLNEIVIFINSYEWKSWMLLWEVSLSTTICSKCALCKSLYDEMLSWYW